MNRKRRKRRSETNPRQSNRWVWVWVAVVVVLVLAMALRRAPVDGAPVVLSLGIATPAAAAESTPDAAAPDAQISEWLDNLRRPDRREPFLEAADKLEERWDAYEDHLEPIVLELLTMPRYAGTSVWRFIGQSLLPEEDEQRMANRAHGFGRFGDGNAEGLRLELRAFIDRNPPVATEQQRRALEIIGEDGIEPDDPDAPVRVTAVEQHTLRHFITRLPRGLGGPYEQAMVETIDEMSRLTHDVYNPVTRAMGEANDYLFVAMAEYIWSEQHVDLKRRFLDARIERSERHRSSLRRLDERLKEEFDG